MIRTMKRFTKAQKIEVFKDTIMYIIRMRMFHNLVQTKSVQCILQIFNKISTISSKYV